MFRNNKNLAHVVIASLLSLGFAVFAGAACFLIAAGLQQFVSYKMIAIDRDGEPFVKEHGTRSVQYRKLDGEEARVTDLSDMHSLPWQNYYWGRSNRPRGWSQRIASFPSSSAYWYLLRPSSDGTAYFVGYEKRGYRIVGYIGVDGFQREIPEPKSKFQLSSEFGSCHLATALGGVLGQPPNRFSSRIANASQLYLATTSRVVHIDFNERSVETFADIANVRSVSGTPHAAIALRTDESVKWYDREGTLRHYCALPSNVGRDLVALWPYSDTGAAINVQPTPAENNLYWYGSGDAQFGAEPVPPERELSVQITQPSSSLDFLGGITALLLCPVATWLMAATTPAFVNIVGYLWLFLLPILLAIVVGTWAFRHEPHRAVDSIPFGIGPSWFAWLLGPSEEIRPSFLFQLQSEGGTEKSRLRGVWRTYFFYTTHRY